ncbi:MAG: RAD55 family ATPase [Dehalococcoidia bacterium]
MILDTTGDSELLRRVPSGIPGLDTILHGGFLHGGSYLVTGPPGSGKTVFGNQACFSHVGAGGRTVYVTVLTETHARMLWHLRSLSFFNPQVIGDSLYYVSGYTALEESGLSGLLDLLLRVIRTQRATLIVLDGLETVRSAAPSDLLLKRFLQDLHVYAESVGCTTLLLTPQYGQQPHLVHEMVDGLIQLGDELTGARAIRELVVPKFRGSDYLRGRHFFQISSDGITVYPRIEALLAHPALVTGEQRTRLPLGVSRLDEMLQGGLLSSSTTLLLGAPGSGKTMLGLHFLAEGARHEERGMYFGFNETPPRLLEKAQGIGLDLERPVHNGTIEIIWQPLLEEVFDALAQRLLESVHRHKPRRLVVDGLDSLLYSAIYPDRAARFVSALTNELRGLDVTTLFSVGTSTLFGPEIAVSLPSAGTELDNIIFLRYVELRSQLHRLMSILKVRESAYDPAIREFQISEQGIAMDATFATAEAILTGGGLARLHDSSLHEDRP